MAIFPPTRAAALTRLAGFAPRAGRAYTAQRNADLPGHPHVSGLSPYLRHRMLTEAEVLAHVLTRHSPAAADKFIAEVFWRTYWKGWLERRPGVWGQYKAGVQAALNRVQTEGQLHDNWQSACLGTTGIACFDHWAQELAQTGYLHNHARMWFASIWIFTLRLPWELGADFFLRHLLDGDPASNTLSWRWVAGIQTAGKTYLARPDNIAFYTGGRFNPTGLATVAPPLPGPPLPALGAVPQSDDWPDAGRIGLLLTEEDLCLDWLTDRISPIAIATLPAGPRSPLHTAPQVAAFTNDLIDDCLTRHSDLGHATQVPDVAALVNWAREQRLDSIVTAYMPTGPAADHLSALRPALAAHTIRLHSLIRPYDAQTWPHAASGFFKFRDAIPRLLAGLEPQSQAKLPFL